MADSKINIAIGVLGGETAKSALDAVTRAAERLFDTFVVDGVKAAAEQEAAITKLNSALAASGNYSKKASDDFLRFADSMQKTTQFSDDAVIAAAGLLESLTGLDEKGLEKATKTAADLSIALGIDLDTAARKVAKTVGAEGVEGLQKFSGTMGLAEAQARTFAGAASQVSNAFNEIQEATGSLVTENQTVIAVISQVKSIFNEIAESIVANKESLQELIGQGVIIAIDGFANLVAAVQLVIVGFREMTAILDTVTLGVVSRIGQAFSNLASEIGSFLGQAKQDINSTLGKDAPLGGVAMRLEEIRKAAVASFDAMRVGASTAVVPVNQVKEATDELTDAEEKRLDAILKGIEEDKKKTQTELEQIDIRRAQIDQAYEDGILAEEDYTEALNAISARRYEAEQKAREDDARQHQLVLTAKLTASQAFNNSLSALATLQSAKSKELQAVGKAAAIAQATIATYTGATGAFAALSSIPFVGPALGFAAAASIVAAGLANVSKIAGIFPGTFEKGIDSVPAGFPRDSFPALLTSGERVVPAETNKDLTNFLRNQQNFRNDLLQGIAQMQNQFIVNIGGKNLVREIQRAVDGGRELNV